MQMKHWFSILVVLVIGYFLGIYFPAYGSKAVSSVQSLVS